MGKRKTPNNRPEVCGRKKKREGRKALPIAMGGIMMEIKGIDVSSYQGNIDWETVSDYGMGFAILRITEKGNRTDPTFERNYSGCKKYGIPVGVYKYSYAKTTAQAEGEAAAVLRVLAGRKLDFPVFYDLEWKEQRALGVTEIEKIAAAFLDKIKEAGYQTGIYCNADWYENVLSAELKKYDCWIARYPADDNGELQERLRPSYGVGWQYSSKASIPGIPTKVDRDVFYKDYKSEKEEGSHMAKTAKAVLDVMRSWIGYSEANGKHKQIIDLYNSVKPLPRGYAVKYTDEWCDATVSAAGIQAGCTDLIGRECGCEEHVKIFKQKGIWIEDGTIMPKPGDIILYNWGQSYQPNDGYSDHIGFVESVSGNQITCIEGNKGEAVARRVLSVGNGNIRGYARPKYEAGSGGTTPEAPTPDPGAEAPKKEVSWYGVVNTAELNVRTWAGTENANLKSYPTIKQGTKVGVCDTVKDKDGDPWYYIRIDGDQGEKYGFVSAAYITKQGTSTPDAPAEEDGVLSKAPKWTGRVTASILNVRSWAGTNNPVIKSWPQLAKGNLVDVCDTVAAADGSKWYYIRIDGRIFGFVHSAYINKKE